MCRLTITLLFSTDKSKEPGGILQCDTSGEFLPFVFEDWRDGVHYIQWCNNKNKKCEKSTSFNEWSDLYGYHECEEFTGDLNEFQSTGEDDPNNWFIFTSVCDVNGYDDLHLLSAWK